MPANRQSPCLPGIGGLRVLDLAGHPAIYGTKLFADLGADVVRVEPLEGDPLRDTAPFFRDQAGPGRSLPFAFYNTSKRSIALEMASSAGQVVFRRLAAWADVLVESEAPGSWDARGLDFKTLAAINPGLIWASVTPFGQAGPRASWKADDLVALAAGGVLYLNGFPDKRPIQSPLWQAYHLGGAAAVSGVLVALWQRHQTGRGQFVEVSLQAAVATATENTIGYWDVNQWNRPRYGNRTFSGATILYRCADGWVAGMSGNRWEELIKWAEDIGIASFEWYDPVLVTREGRSEQTTLVNRLINELFARQTVAQVARRAEQIRLPIQHVNLVSDLFHDPQLAYRGFWVALPHPDLGATITYPGAPFQSSSGFWQLRHRAPLPGEHSREVLAELGYDLDTIAALQDAGVVQAWTIVKPRRAAAIGVSIESLNPPPVTLELRFEDKPKSDAPLRGVRVLDFGQAVAGPMVGRTLADFGAEVIKIEWSQRPDPQRFFAPRPPGNPSPNVCALFNLVNASKRSFTLDLNQPKGRALLKRLVEISDVILDNYGNDPFPKWGLTYEEARALRPDIVMARSSTVGRTGPRTGMAGLGYGIAAAAGWNQLMGFPGEPPVGMGPAYPDYSVNCHHFLVAILVALEHRRRTGEGQYIDLSQHESTTTWIGPAILDYTANGRIPSPGANRDPAYAPHGVYPGAGKDRWIAIAVEETTWPAFVAVAAQDSVFFEEERFATHSGRKAAEDAMDRIVSAWTVGHDSVALAVRLQDAGVAASNVATGQEIVDDPQLNFRQHFVRLSHPEAGERLWDRHAFRLSEASGMPERSPLLGEHNDWVLEKLLGCTPDEISETYVAGVVG